MKTKKTPTEKMICEIFKLCDETVWVEDWLEFQKAFEKILKKFGHDLYPIYFGKSKKEFIKTQKATYAKWFADNKKKKARNKTNTVWVKGKEE